MEQEEKTDKDNATEVGNMFIYFLYCTSLCSNVYACSVADVDPDPAGSISFCQNPKPKLPWWKQILDPTFCIIVEYLGL
jgi:hypothetical protein